MLSLLTEYMTPNLSKKIKFAYKRIRRLGKT